MGRISKIKEALLENPYAETALLTDPLFSFCRHKSCIPTRRGVRTKEIPVFLYPVTSDIGPVSAQCSVAILEEHTACTCGCARPASSCNYNQRFDSSRCTCACLDHRAKEACYNRPGWFWNEDTCQCMCRPASHWPQCPIGYQFDPLSSCSCVSVSEYATPVLAMLIVILVLGVFGTLAGMIHCHRKNIGFFSYRRRLPQHQSQSRMRSQSTTSHATLQQHRISNASTISNKLISKLVGGNKPQSSSIRKGSPETKSKTDTEQPLVKQRDPEGST